MKATILINLFLILFGCSSSRPAATEAWINFKFDRAVAYYYSPGLLDEEFVENAKINPLVQPNDGVELSDTLIQQLNSILSSPDKYIGYSVMDCFLPRHGVVFWDEDKPIAWISVCFECGKMTTNPVVEKEELVDLKTFFKRLGFPTE